MKKIAFYGGSFDPVHRGHLAIAEKLTEIFELDEFVLIPAFHAPHKTRQKPTSAFHRFAMLCLATDEFEKIRVSAMELEIPEKPYTIETLTKLKNDLDETDIFFVMGADSWMEITTWREWERVLTTVNIIVVTRPNYEIGFAHVTEKIRERIVDLRGLGEIEIPDAGDGEDKIKIFITDAVRIDVSATRTRRLIRENDQNWKDAVTKEIAGHIEKYQLYK